MTTATLTDADKARAIATAAFRLAEHLDTTRNEWTPRAQFRLFDLINASIALFECGDLNAELETVMSELGIDEDGNPVRPESDLCAMPRGYAMRAALNPIACNGGL